MPTGLGEKDVWLLMAVFRSREELYSTQENHLPCIRSIFYIMVEIFKPVTFVCANFKNINPASSEILRRKTLCCEILSCTFYISQLTETGNKKKATLIMTINIPNMSPECNDTVFQFYGQNRGTKFTLDGNLPLE